MDTRQTHPPRGRHDPATPTEPWAGAQGATGTQATLPSAPGTRVEDGSETSVTGDGRLQLTSQPR